MGPVTALVSCGGRIISGGAVVGWNSQNITYNEIAYSTKSSLILSLANTNLGIIMMTNQRNFGYGHYAAPLFHLQAGLVA